MGERLRPAVLRQMIASQAARIQQLEETDPMTESLLAWAERIVGDDSISETGPVKPWATQVHDLFGSIREELDDLQRQEETCVDKLRDIRSRRSALTTVVQLASKPVDKPKRPRLSERFAEAEAEEAAAILSQAVEAEERELDADPPSH